MVFTLILVDDVLEIIIKPRPDFEANDNGFKILARCQELYCLYPRQTVLST